MKKRVTVMLGMEKMFYVRKVVNIKKANGEKSSIIDWVESAIQEKLDRDGMPEIENYTYDYYNNPPVEKDDDELAGDQPQPSRF